MHFVSVDCSVLPRSASPVDPACVCLPFGPCVHIHHCTYCYLAFCVFSDEGDGAIEEQALKAVLLVVHLPSTAAAAASLPFTPAQRIGCVCEPLYFLSLIFMQCYAFQLEPVVWMDEVETESQSCWSNVNLNVLLCQLTLRLFGTC